MSSNPNPIQQSPSGQHQQFQDNYSDVKSQHEEDQPSNLQPKRKNPNQEKQSEVRKVLINNLRHEKPANNDSYDGTYLYKPGVELPSLYHFSNQSIKIIIAAEYIKKHNPEVVRRNIYGTETYTSNSDAVCILAHCGYANINNFPGKRFQGVQLTCKVIKPKKNYNGSNKNGLLSRTIKGYNGNALKPQTCKNLTSLDSMELLERYAANMHIPIGKNRVKSKPKNLSTITPIPQTHIVFNSHNEPSYKYSIFNLADKCYEKNDFLVSKLDNMVLYLESQNKQKFELVKRTEKQLDYYCFSKLINPQRFDNQFMNREKSPLDEEYLEKIEEFQDLQNIKWGNTSVQIKGKLISNIKSFKFYKKQK